MYWTLQKNIRNVKKRVPRRCPFIFMIVMLTIIIIVMLTITAIMIVRYIYSKVVSTAEGRVVMEDLENNPHKVAGKYLQVFDLDVPQQPADIDSYIDTKKRRFAKLRRNMAEQAANAAVHRVLRDSKKEAAAKMRSGQGQDGSVAGYVKFILKEKSTLRKV
ncbi:hypothetical protein Bpfe_017105 [Biomphalaria pfeifferi]|uniref:Uncharacterized protein n=1 Tax=Biomphalaria pfeifferi TaxID=112525 RepID=A0AAD8BFQ3_BIOPF|nr:hypothetical protein Bpfe_017105 [Biomphalaria pfeifferi]